MELVETMFLEVFLGGGYTTFARVSVVSREILVWCAKLFLP